MMKIITDFSKKHYLDHDEFDKYFEELKERIIHKTTTENWKKYKNTNYYVAKSGAIIYSEKPINSDDSIGYDNYKNCLPWIMGNNGPKVVINNEDLDVHMVVAETFKPIDNQDKKYEVHHIDGNSYNNSVENLIWLLKNDHKLLPK